MCLAQGHNAVTMVMLEPVALRSRVKHSTTEPLCSLGLKLIELVMKVLEHVVEGLIRQRVGMDDMQFGFMPGCGTPDMIIHSKPHLYIHEVIKLSSFSNSRKYIQFYTKNICLCKPMNKYGIIDQKDKG